MKRKKKKEENQKMDIRTFLSDNNVKYLNKLSFSLWNFQLILTSEKTVKLETLYLKNMIIFKCKKISLSTSFNISIFTAFYNMYVSRIFLNKYD